MDSKDTCLFGHLDSLLDHVDEVLEVLIRCGQSLDVVPHSDDEDGAASFVDSAKPVFA